LHDFFLLRASCFKSKAGTSVVFSDARQQAFAKAAAENDPALAPARIVAQRNERTFRGSGITVGQRASEPVISDLCDRIRALGQDRIDRLMKWSCVCFPGEFKLSPTSLRFNIIGQNTERAIQRPDGIGEAAQKFIAQRDLLQSENIAGVQLHRMLQIAQREDIKLDEFVTAGGDFPGRVNLQK
jgi:hypothetical protein